MMVAIVNLRDDLSGDGGDRFEIFGEGGNMKTQSTFVYQYLREKGSSTRSHPTSCF